MIKAEIVCDSLNPVGNRLTTFVLEYPRFVHAEFMTHRVFSRNAASSRAIPIEKMIEQVRINPAMPVWWGKNQSGMQAKEQLDDTQTIIQQFLGETFTLTDREMAKHIWLKARDKAIEFVLELNKLGLHKQIANRILEPWFNIRIVASATDLENFFALRHHEDAQPEIKELAVMMLDLYNASEPKELLEGQWHVPFGDKFDEIRILQLLAKQNGGWAASPQQLDDAKRRIAVARCARVSYFNFEGKDDYEADIKLCNRLFGSNPKHLSPTEHVACAMNSSDWSGNFRGFKQFRKTFADENLTDIRVVKKGKK